MKQSTSKIVRSIADAGQDFEWYPTTAEIIDVVKSDLDMSFQKIVSVLDCGAGDGRVLQAITKGKKYAIEKSRPLLDLLSSEIFVVGTDFESQTLIDKKVDVIFSNPPYSNFVEWAAKIIDEANAKLIYLVIPSRWKNSNQIDDAIKLREAKSTVLGSFDFENADRKARAKVDVVKIELNSFGMSKIDPFSLWFEKNFSIDLDRRNSINSRSLQIKESTENALIKGGDIVSILEKLYQRDMDNLMKNYKNISELDGDILEELGVSVKGLQESLMQRITNLKDVYWNELFNNLSKVTDRLTKASRRKLLDTLTDHTHVDFSVSNAHAVLCWVVKNANHYFDKQLVETVERMVEKANVKLYRSNKKTFGDEDWRYCSRPDSLDAYQLELRAVFERIGGIYHPQFSWERLGARLDERAEVFIDDLCTIANNIGFDTKGLDRAKEFEWVSGKKVFFHYRNNKTEKNEVLFEVKAFKNGNLHIKFNQAFMCKMNVEFGRLKGWIKSPREASYEMDVSLDQAIASFASNHQFISSSPLSMLVHEKAVA